MWDIARSCDRIEHDACLMFSKPGDHQGLVCDLPLDERVVDLIDTDSDITCTNVKFVEEMKWPLKLDSSSSFVNDLVLEETAVIGIGPACIGTLCTLQYLFPRFDPVVMGTVNHLHDVFREPAQTVDE